jgi:membrane protease YdiL (CAAX protease family)
MGALGIAWATIAHGSAFAPQHQAWFSAEPAHALVIGFAAAFAIAAATVTVTRLLVTRTEWARRLHLALRVYVIDLTFSRIVLLSLLSAAGEELLFRAALQPSLGIITSACLFGAVHVPPRGTGLVWPLWATLMGVAFGILYQAAGHIGPPILAHALINYENMQYIRSYDPTPLDISRLHTHARNARW